VQTSIACFAAGTRIRAHRGEVAVEALRAGDLVILADGRTAPVRWIGHRSIDCRRHARPRAVWPVRVAAGALGVGPPGVGPPGVALPERELLLSPDHAIYLNGVLIPVRLLINHASIEQIQTDRITYYHVELDRHDLLLAEGVATESYLDTGNREMFENGGQPLALHPDFAIGQRARELGSCVPFVSDPRQVEPVWRALAERAKATGWMPPEPPLLEDDPDLHVLAGNRRIDPIEARDGRYAFVLPSRDASLRLASRTARACDERPWIDDDRRLGVKLRRLTHRRDHATRDVAIDDPLVDRGWWAVEWDRGGPCRWTSGEATLPSLGRGILEVTLCGSLRYPVAASGHAVLAGHAMSG
jgi:Hint domain